MKINVAFQGNDRLNDPYYSKRITTIVQMLTKTNEYINIYIIGPKEFNNKEDITEKIKKYSDFNNFEIIITEPSKIWDNMKMDGHDLVWHTSVYWRCGLFETLPDVDKIAYFDTDVYFNCNVKDFFNIEIPEGIHYLGIDESMWTTRSVLDKKLFYPHNLPKECYIKLLENYACSGIMLFNLKKMREDKLMPKILEYANMNLPRHDQDTMNFACNVKVLDRTYGSPHFNQNQKMLHWFKPWNWRNGNLSPWLQQYVMQWHEIHRKIFGQVCFA